MKARILGIAGALLVLGILPFIIGWPNPHGDPDQRRSQARRFYDAGVIAARGGDFESAAAALNSAVELDPTFLDAYLEWRDVLKYLGREHEMWKVLHDRRARSPDDPVLAFLEAHRAGGDQGSIPRSCTRIEGPPPSCDVALGSLALEAGDFQSAAVTFERALTNHPSRTTRVEARIGLVEALLRAGHPEQATDVANAAWAELERDADLPGLLKFSSLRYSASRWGSFRVKSSEAVEKIEADARRAFREACNEAKDFLHVACLLNEIEEYRVEGRNAQALATSNLALEIIRGRNAPLLVGKLLTLRCELAATIGRIDDALPDCASASSLHLEHDDDYGALPSLEWTVQLHSWRSDIPAGLRAARTYREVARRAKSDRDLVSALSSLGWLAFQGGRIEEVQVVLREMESHLERSGTWSNEVGSLYEALGDYRTALVRYHATAQDPAASWIAESRRLIALTNLSRIYLLIGEVDAAESFARSYFERYRSLHDREDLPVPNLPEVLAAKGRLNEALRAAQVVLQITRSGDDPRLVAQAREEVVRVRLAAGHHAETANELSSLVDEYDRLGLFREHARTLIALADARVRIHDLEGGFAALAEARAYGAATQDREIEWRAAYLEGRIFELRGELRSALVSYRRAIRGLEDFRLSLPEGNLRSAFLTGRLDPYEGALHLLLAGEPSPARIHEAFLVSEAKKARALRDLVRGSEASVPVVSPYLHEGEALIEFTFVRDTLWVFVVREGISRAERLPTTRSEIQALARELRAPLEALEAGRITIAQARWPIAASTRLYDALFRPLESYLVGARTVFLVPEDELWLVPFDALVTRPTNETNRSPQSLPFQEYEGIPFLVDRYAIAYLPSADWLLPPTGQRTSLTGLLAIGDPRDRRGRPLPISRDEVTRIAALVPGSVVLGGRKASESRFLDLAPRYRLLHVAAHSIADPTSPTSSGLALSPDSIADGFVGALDLARLRLDADMVVLSACRTAAGPIRRGEGVMALSRMFLGAGARSVLATQWSIPDAAGGIMPRFYQGLIAGGDAAHELRLAKLEFRQTLLEGAEGQRISAAHPIYWAPFILVGYPRLTLGDDVGPLTNR